MIALCWVMIGFAIAGQVVAVVTEVGTARRRRAMRAHNALPSTPAAVGHKDGTVAPA